MKEKDILKRIKNLEKRVSKLEKTKQDKKIYGHEKGKPIHKEDLLKCEKCGKNLFKGCQCD